MNRGINGCGIGADDHDYTDLTNNIAYNMNAISLAFDAKMRARFQPEDGTQITTDSSGSGSRFWNNGGPDNATRARRGEKIEQPREADIPVPTSALRFFLEAVRNGDIRRSYFINNNLQGKVWHWEELLLLADPFASDEELAGLTLPTVAAADGPAFASLAEVWAVIDGIERCAITRETLDRRDGWYWYQLVSECTTDSLIRRRRRVNYHDDGEQRRLELPLYAAHAMMPPWAIARIYGAYEDGTLTLDDLLPRAADNGWQLRLSWIDLLELLDVVDRPGPADSTTTTTPIDISPPALATLGFFGILGLQLHEIVQSGWEGALNQQVLNESLRWSIEQISEFLIARGEGNGMHLN